MISNNKIKFLEVFPKEFLKEISEINQNKLFCKLKISEELHEVIEERVIRINFKKNICGDYYRHLTQKKTKIIVLDIMSEQFEFLEVS